MRFLVRVYPSVDVCLCGQKRLLLRRVIALCVLPLGILVSAFSHAAPDCRPWSIVGRAVGGAIGNAALGGFNPIAGAAAGIDNGVSPTPSGLMRDCILPAINPPPPDDPDDFGFPFVPSPDRSPAGGWGDPHLISHDGLGFDFQGAGDYAYVEGEGITLQARQFRLSANANVSRLKAFAVQSGDTKVVINDPIDTALLNSEAGLTDLVTVDGVDMPIGLGGWIDLDSQGSFIQRFQGHFFLRLVGKLHLLISDDGNTFKLALDEALKGSVSGMLGNFDGDPSNDLKTASGVSFSIEDTATLYGDYLDGWRREGEASLFNSEFNPAVDGGHGVTDAPLLSDTALTSREAAAQHCLDAGVAEGFYLNGCIYDMVFDENEQWLNDAADFSIHSGSLVPAAALSTPAATVIALGVNASVSPTQPGAGAGNIQVAHEVDRYSISLPSGTQRVLQTIAPCSIAQPFSVLLELDDGPAVEFALSCDASISLPAGQLALSVFSHSGDTGGYSFNIVEPAITDLGVITLDTLIEGDLAATERLSATLPSTAGDKVFIASNQDTSCEAEWQVLDATGIVLKRNSVCNDLGLVTLNQNRPYRIIVQQASASGYAFTVLSVGESSVIDPGDDRQFNLIIGTPGQQASASFPVVAGERIYVDRDGGVGSGTLTIADPQSNTVVVTALNTEDTQFEASVGGQYTLTLQPNDDFTGTVPVNLVSIADDTNTTVSRGQAFTLTLNTLGQRATASFDATVGDTFTVTESVVDAVSGLTITPHVQPPDGANPLAVFGSRTITATVSGTYQIVLDSSELDDFIGTVAFELN